MADETKDPATNLPATQQSQFWPSLTPQAEQGLRDVFGDAGLPSLHSFQGDAREVWKQIAKVSASDCLGYDDVVNSTIAIHHFYCHPVQFEDELSSEITQQIRCVLIPKEGMPTAFVSEGIAKDLAGIIRTFGMGPYDPEIEVRPVAVKTRKGFRTYRLVPAE